MPSRGKAGSSPLLIWTRDINLRSTYNGIIAREVQRRTFCQDIRLCRSNSLFRVVILTAVWGYNLSYS